jgi:hypothetical protein
VDNPGEAIADVVLALERLGCTVVGLPATPLTPANLRP